MPEVYVLKEYFMRYLRDIKGLSDKSINHYLSALDVISQYLKEQGKLKSNIYEVLDLYELSKLRDDLYEDADFVEKDERGHRMYSAGLNNYYNFAGTDDLSQAQNDAELDIMVAPAAHIEVVQSGFRRSSIIKRLALSRAGYQCEISHDHKTFTNRYTSKPYMEGHHLIPMQLQDEFDYSLDVCANIVCLCPLCHRMLHFGIKDDEMNLLKKIYDDRINRLDKSGLYVAKEDFIDLIVGNY